MRKSFKILISKKLPNDTIACMEFITEKESLECLVNDGSGNCDLPDDAMLFKSVYESTMRDLQALVKDDPLAASLYDAVQKGAELDRKIKK